MGRICGRCLKPIKRGEDYLEAVGIRFHMSCVKNAADKAREEKTAREQAQMQEEARP